MTDQPTTDTTTDVVDDAGSGGEVDVDEYAAAVPLPAIVRWDELGTADYRRELTRLAGWVGWLVSTYRLQPAVVPPCWWAHPGQVETLSHLHVGWQLSRHTDAGVGMAGLDWDSRRVAAVEQLRDLVQVSSCDSRNHTEPTPIPWLTSPDQSAAFAAHLDAAAQRDRQQQTQARTAAAEEVLAELDAQPAEAVTAATVAEALQRAWDAAEAADALHGTVADTADTVGRLDEARRALAEHIAANGPTGPDHPVAAAWIAVDHRTAATDPAPPAAGGVLDGQLPDEVLAALNDFRSTRRPGAAQA